MGFRTLVVLYNDQASEWEKDPELGKKIAIGMNYAMNPANATQYSPANLHYGKVVECSHADTQRLAVVDSYNVSFISSSFWRPNEPFAERDLRLLKEAADKLGYRLVKKG